MIEHVISDVVLNTAVLPEIMEHDILGVDVETRGLNPRKDEIVLLQISTPEKAYVIDVRKISPATLLAAIYFSNKLLIGHNIKFDLEVLKANYDFTYTRVYDTMVAYGVINNGRESPYVSLKYLLKQYCGVEVDKDVRETFAYTFGELTNEQINYAATDVMYLHNIYNEQLKEIKKSGLFKTLRLEFDVLPIVVEMEHRGIKLDRDAWGKLIVDLPSKMDILLQQMKDYLSGVLDQDFVTSFNPRSPVQVKKAFMALGHNIESTRETVLKYVKDELARLILEYRGLDKSLSTYGENFYVYLDDEDVIHADYSQVGTKTGRFSSAHPNMQNIPAAKEYRSCFVARDGYYMITADFSQIELRIAAVMSGEENMLSEYSKDDADLHTHTASLIYKIPPDQVKPEQRSRAKNGNFSALYGISAYAFASRYDVSKKEAEELLGGFWESYPTLKKFMDEQRMLAVKRGYTKTALGRRRYYIPPAMNSVDYYRDINRIAREGANFPIQGTAADIMKLSMVKIHDRIKHVGGYIINTVHDEIEVEIPKHMVKEGLEIVESGMKEAAREILGDVIPWNVGINYSESWEKV